jgi:hypothetical protein
VKNLIGSSCALAITLLLVSGCGGDNAPFADDAGGDASDDTGATPDATSVGKPDASKTPDAGTDTGSQPDVNVPSDTGTGADVAVPDSGPAPDAGDAGDGSTATPDASTDDGGGAGALPAAVAIWEFQDPAGSLVALDSSGNNHTATLKGTAAIIGAGIPDAGTPDAGAPDAGDAGEAGSDDAGASEEAGASEAGAAEAGASEAGVADAGSSSTGPSAFGNYLQIDGTPGAFADVEGGPLFDNTKSFTLSTWVYFPTLNNQYDELISIDGAHVSVGELQLAPTGGTYNMEATFPAQDVAQPTTFYFAFSTNPVPATTWTHLVGVYDLTPNPGTTPGAISLYVNGVLQSNSGDGKAIGVNPVAAVGDFIIGAGKYNDQRTSGAVANYVGVRVYAQALTAAQVTTLFGLKGR